MERILLYLNIGFSELRVNKGFKKWQNVNIFKIVNLS
jgi:hypothetical protein